MNIFFFLSCSSVCRCFLSFKKSSPSPDPLDLISRKVMLLAESAFDQTGLRSSESREGNPRNSECQDLSRRRQLRLRHRFVSGTLFSSSLFLVIYFLLLSPASRGRKEQSFFRSESVMHAHLVRLTPPANGIEKLNNFTGKPKDIPRVISLQK